jgi:two-component system, sensor histidine kinase and response regulator
MIEPLALIVEDDEDINEIFGQALASAGFSIHSVRDGQAALEFLKGMVPHVVILDLHLPNVSGEAILKYIRSTPGLEKVRVVITTADAAFGEYLQDQADFVMVKPISYVQLRDLTRRLNPATQTGKLKPEKNNLDE